MVEHDFIFSPNSLAEAGSFKLLELPPDLCSLIESHLENTDASPPSLCIKGNSTDDAVLCTSDKTYNIRSIVLSNTIVVATPSPDGSENDVAIRDQVNEILELTRSVPKLNKIDTLLKGSLYTGEEEDTYDDDDMGEGGLSYDDLLNEVQASRGELDEALKKRRILDFRGRLRQISSEHLNAILQLMLTQLASLSITNLEDVPVRKLADALDGEHEIPKSVSMKVMEWFGEIKVGGQGSRWKMDLTEVVRETGLGILRGHKGDPIQEKNLIKLWKEAVGDTFESIVNIDLLLGNFLANAIRNERLLTYFPASSLPSEPAARFQHLFLTRTRWKSSDITPFLSDIAVDSKERDKLLLKFSRSATDSEGVWYTARTMFMG